VSVVKELIQPRSKEQIAATLKKIGAPPASSLAERLDPQTYRPWLFVAKARLAGLADEQISRALELDTEVVRNIVVSPTYLYFESVFRQVMTAGPDMAIVQQRIMQGVMSALDALDHWVAARDPALASVSLGAARTYLSAGGVDVERKKVTKTSIHGDLTSTQVDRLISALSDR